MRIWVESASWELVESWWPRSAMYTKSWYSRWRPNYETSVPFQSAAGRHLLEPWGRSTTRLANYRPTHSWSTCTTLAMDSTFLRRRASCASISGEVLLISPNNIENMICSSKIHTFKCEYLEIFFIRKLYLPKDAVDPQQGRQGIAQRPPEWTKLKESIVQLHKAIPALSEALPCSFGVDHSIDYISCGKCLPFDVIDHHITTGQGVDTYDNHSITSHTFDTLNSTDDDECAIMSLNDK